MRQIFFVIDLKFLIIFYLGSTENRQTSSLKSDFRELGDPVDVVLDFFSEGLLGVKPMEMCALFDASPSSIQARMKIM